MHRTGSRRGRATQASGRSRLFSHGSALYDRRGALSIAHPLPRAGLARGGDRGRGRGAGAVPPADVGQVAVNYFTGPPPLPPLSTAPRGRGRPRRAALGVVGPAPVGPAPVGPAPVGPAPVGPAPVGPAPGSRPPDVLHAHV